tara:strand:+ start:320 stop:547 length:228 start_codon:yes stop_codon:yes gene_type:complete
MENKKVWLIKGTKEFIMMMAFFAVVVVVLSVASYSVTLVGLHPTVGLLAMMMLALYGLSLQNAYAEEQRKRKRSE